MRASYRWTMWGSRSGACRFDRAREALGTTRAQTWGFEDATYALRTLNAAGYHTFGVYDCDLSGTFEELAGEADMVARSFEAVSAADFLKAANPHVRVVYKPVAKAGAAAAAGGAGVACGGRTQGDPFLRAENEDDDGYDPYSDRREETPLSRRAPGISGRFAGALAGALALLVSGCACGALALGIARARAEARRHPVSPFRLDVSFPRGFVIQVLIIPS